MESDAFPESPTLYQIHEDSEDRTWIFMDDGYWHEWSPHQMPSDYIKELKALSDLRAKLAQATAALEAIKSSCPAVTFDMRLIEIESVARHALAKIRS